MSVTKIVEKLLKRKPPLRDSDVRLKWKVWGVITRQRGQDLGEMNGRQIAKMEIEGNLPHSETIRRTRQKLQEKNIWLRGREYDNRQEAAEVHTNRHRQGTWLD